MVKNTQAIRRLSRLPRGLQDVFKKEWKAQADPPKDASKFEKINGL